MYHRILTAVDETVAIEEGRHIAAGLRVARPP
jgi:hypothetical protein